MKKFQYIVVLLFVIVLGTGCSNDEKQENFLSLNSFLKFPCEGES